jgi:molybdopterin converting factor small subunit
MGVRSDLPAGVETSTTASGTVTVRYWAAAKAAAGRADDTIEVAGVVSLAELRDRAAALHPGSRLGAVLAVCSVLVGDQPVASLDPAAVEVRAGDTVEFLPPFAGG